MKIRQCMKSDRTLCLDTPFIRFGDSRLQTNHHHLHSLHCILKLPNPVETVQNLELA